MSEDRGQRSEVRGQRSEDGGQRTDDPPSLCELRRGRQRQDRRSVFGRIQIYYGTVF